MLNLFGSLGQGMGELKSLAGEHWLTADVIRTLKELDSVDSEAADAYKRRDYPRYLSCISRQLSLTHKVERYCMVRQVRAEYHYKSVLKMLDSAEKKCQEQLGHLKREARKSAKDKGAADYRSAEHRVHGLLEGIKKMRHHVQELRRHVRKGCEASVRTIRHIHRFA